MPIIHIVAGLLLIFFILFNAINPTGNITNEWCLNKKHILDNKVVSWILWLKNKKFSEINEIAYHKIRYSPFILLLIAYLVILLSKGSKSALIFVIAVIYIIPFLLLGFLSFNRLLKNIKEWIKTTAFYIALAVLVFAFFWLVADKHTFNLLFAEFQKPTRELNQNIRSLHITGIEGYSTYVIVLAALVIYAIISLILWAIYRLCAKLMMVLFIAIAKFCYLLNNNSPLKAFYLLFQICSVLVTEMIAKSIT